MSLTKKDIDIMEYMAANPNVDATYNCDAGHFRVKNKIVFRQYEELHRLEDDCQCWRRINLRDEKMYICCYSSNEDSSNEDSDDSDSS
jgi:hypothetical protein